MNVLAHIFSDYGKLLGQKVNWTKSNIYFGKVLSFRRSLVLRQIIGVNYGTLPFNYLGVPLF